MAERGVDFISSLKELDILYKLSKHENVLEIKYFTFTHPMMINFKRDYKVDSLFFVFDLADCDLLEMIDSERLKFTKFYSYAYQITSGLCYIHANKIIHRDIKPENILYFRNQDCFKICDFGLSKMIVTNQKNTLNMVVPCYRAPEIFFGNDKYDYKIDVFSLGIVLHEMIHQDMFTKSSKDERISFKRLLERIPDSSDNVVIYSDHKITKEELRVKLEDSDNKIACVFSIGSNEFNDYPNIKFYQLKKIDMFSDTKYLEEYNIIKQMIKFNSVDRISSFEVLDILRNKLNVEKIESFKYDKDIILHINNNYDRENTRNKFLDIHHKLESKEWFNFKVLFSAIDLFDRFVSNNKIEEIHLILTCLYLSIKYNNSLTNITSFKDLLLNLSLYSPKTFPLIYKTVKELERELINILHKDLFRITIYDISCEFNDNLNDEDILKLFEFYFSLVKEESIRYCYKQFRSKLGFLSSP
jgi:serine/threonine protein kinase